MAGLAKELQEARKSLAAFKAVQVPVMRELAQDKLRETHLLLKGNFLSPGDKVQPALLKSFHPAPATESLTRLAVAHWLTSRDNPLTARVAVNRYWAQLFGRGIQRMALDRVTVAGGATDATMRAQKDDG